MARSTGMALGLFAAIAVGAIFFIICGGGAAFLFLARSSVVPGPVMVTPAGPVSVGMEEEPTIDQQPAEREESPKP